jgi:AraC-like DNA-binding protein
METKNNLPVPSSYSRVVARELGLQERDLGGLLQGTGLPVSILRPGDETHMSAAQQMRVLGNALRISGTPEFGLRLGHRMQPSSHGPMGYLVLSSPDVISALESFAGYLPLRLPFSSVYIALEPDWLTCTLELKIEPEPDVRCVLQECFALMLQSVVESVLGRELEDSRIGLSHPKPAYYPLYDEYFHTAVQCSQPTNTFQIPAALARISNASGNSDSYSVAQELCRRLLEQIPATRMSTTDQVSRLLLSSPSGALTATDVARAMYVTKRTLQRRLEQEGTSYREITEKLNSELAARHLRDSDRTIEAVATLLGYCDTAAFRKAFHRWYGQSPSEYRLSIHEPACP